MKIREYAVDNLGCAGCAAKIQHEGSKMSGILNSNLDLYKKKMIVETDDSFNEKQFLSDINKIADKLEPGTKIYKKENDKIRTREYVVENLDCAGCAAKIQHESSKLKGIINSNLDLYKKNITVETDSSFDEESFLEQINTIADKLEPGTLIYKAENEDDNDEARAKREKELALEKAEEKKEKFLLIIGAALFIISVFLKPFPMIKLAVSIIAYIILGGDVVLKSFKNITKGNFLDENFLMTIATFGAFYLGETTEAVGVMLFYKVGEYFQESAVRNSRKSIEKLLDIRPDYANIRDNNGEVIKISPKKLKIGDIIIIKSGEKVPVDGIVVKGESDLNTAALTGESIPADVTVNSEVLSGSLNGAGVLEVKVTKLFSDSTINKIIEMVENASNKKAESEKFITKFARYYTPIVVITALIVGIGFPLLFGNFNMWFGRALIFLVISCPCALVLSVPLTFFSSIGKASKSGILIKGGNYLEALTNISAVVFDKTGTLTKGKFKIDRLEAQNGNEDELLKTAKIGEFYSNHPIGKAIVSYGSIDINEEYIEGYKELSGFGVLSYYEGKMILIGNYKLMKEYKIEAEEKNYAGTVLYVAQDNVFLGYIYISDEIKEDSPLTIEGLRKSGIQSYMLTGDSNKIGTVVGEKLGLNSENIYSQLLPQDKVNKLEEIKSKNNKGIVFVGDGVNDAPVLSLADVGIAMGGVGSDIAIEAADVVIMKDEPSKILELLKIAKQNKKVVMQNIIMALGIKVIVMILGVFGIANMWMAIFSDVGVSLLAVLNASQGIKRN
ncbi:MULTISPECIES: heavy metal translocating P-type ATPase [Fusobacterium]|uniref:heavy metal translocating P-type ATPase n=1 Tax=Fusobacterium TaxID=848 RepID=UPI0008A24A6E|nr:MULTISPECIES: heavy metal translocating P-type ATPase [Fusobacterium]OFL81426.1 ATPase [Fusobacterium sp. HMSC073F01]